MPQQHPHRAHDGGKADDVGDEQPEARAAEHALIKWIILFQLISAANSGLKTLMPQVTRCTARAAEGRTCPGQLERKKCTLLTHPCARRPIEGRTSTPQWMCVPGSRILQMLSCKKRVSTHLVPPHNISKPQTAMVSEALKVTPHSKQQEVEYDAMLTEDRHTQEGTKLMGPVSGSMLTV